MNILMGILAVAILAVLIQVGRVIVDLMRD
jgi:hypothetical protein